jgi:hypothetical protein
VSDITLYILYLSLWRVIVVLCGALSIYLGYRLFVIGYSQGETNMEGSFRGATVALRNFAPGTAFALFGAILIGVMVALSPAEITLGLPAPAPAGGPITAEQTDLDYRSGAGIVIMRGD